MKSFLPKFLLNEIDLYLDDSQKSIFEEKVKSIVSNASDYDTISKDITAFLLNEDFTDLTTYDQMLILVSILLNYWKKDYSLIFSIYDKFHSFDLPLSVMICFLLFFQESFDLTTFNLWREKIEEYITNISDSTEKEFLKTAIEQFASKLEQRPEVGYRSMNQLIRSLEENEHISYRYPFVFEALEIDLIQYSNILADEVFSEIWIESARRRAEVMENYGMLVQVNSLLASILVKEYHLEKAKEKIEEGLEIAKRINSPILAAQIELNKALLLKMQGKLDEALKLYEKIAKVKNLPQTFQLDIYSKIGEIYLNKDEIVKAEEYYLKAHEINKKLNFINPLVEIVIGYINLILEKDKGEALDEGLKIAEEQFDFSSIPYYYFYKGIYEQQRVNLSLSIEYLEQALNSFEHQKNFEGIVYTNGALAESYLQIYKLLHDNKYSSRFLYYIDNLIEILKELNNPLYVEAIKTKAGYYLDKGLIKNAEDLFIDGIEFARTRGLKEEEIYLKESLTNKKNLTKITLEGTQILFRKIRMFSFGKHKTVPTKLYLLLAINEAGIPLVSHSFTEEEMVDDLLVSGLISAIINFSSEVLGKGGETLRSINHEGKAVIVEKKDNVMGILVAEDENFEMRLELRQFLQKALDKLVSGLPIVRENDSEIFSIIEEVFERK
ncbi:MAG: tetratricopeptide repeat protein [Candidatus Heimdallarchaeum aukensis]|uniref:Tetratricopeptide repeat protein n=1 Tax=Candidatus Heimdallarchaeum aukensis TaxID=2876573 RepID=A0A9Y1FLH1_9ARCH|nr:MAG: tetratricopeptide repeat protein [Candidatus Heimdallarchaeum aukensis]